MGGCHLERRLTRQENRRADANMEGLSTILVYHSMLEFYVGQRALVTLRSPLSTLIVVREKLERVRLEMTSAAEAKTRSH